MDTNMYRARLMELYTTYAPHKVDQVEALLERNAGKEAALIEAVEKKYCAQLNTSASVSTTMDSSTDYPAPPASSLPVPALARPGATVHKFQPYSQYGGDESTMGSVSLTLEDMPPPPPPPGPPAPVVAPSAPAANSVPGSYYREELTNLFLTYSPDSMRTVDELLEQYKGREAALVTAIRNKYENTPLKTRANDSATTTAAAAVADTPEFRAPPPTSSSHVIPTTKPVAAVNGGIEERQWQEGAMPSSTKHNGDQAPAPAVQSVVRDSVTATAFQGEARTTQEPVRAATHSSAVAATPAKAADHVVNTHQHGVQLPPKTQEEEKEKKDAQDAERREIDKLWRDIFQSFGISRVGELNSMDVVTAQLVSRKVLSPVGTESSKAALSAVTEAFESGPSTINEQQFVSTIMHVLSKHFVEDDKKEASAGQLVTRLKSVKKACRAAVPKPSTSLAYTVSESKLSDGFWVHRCSFPSVHPMWVRCWAAVSAEGEALSICRRGSMRVEWTIPFSSMAKCHLLAMIDVNAPAKFARNGFVVEVLGTSGVGNIRLCLCTEDMRYAQGVVKVFRQWQKQQKQQDASHYTSTSHHTSTLLDDSSFVAHSAENYLSVPVWCCWSGRRVYVRVVWSFEGLLLLHYRDEDKTNTAAQSEKCAWSLTDVTSVVVTDQLPGSYPPRFAKFGFVIRCGSGVSLFCCAESLSERSWVVGQIRRRMLLMAYATAEERGNHGVDASRVAFRMPGATASPATTDKKQQQQGFTSQISAGSRNLTYSDTPTH